MTHVAPVYHEILEGVALSCVFGESDESVYADDGCVGVDRYELLVEVFPEKVSDSLLQRRLAE